MLLVLSMTGLAAAATLVDDTTPATLSTFEDLNGNGIDDDCETAVTADAAAVTAAMAAVDANADGVISTTEAAHSGWVGGKNCNHGGYVSWVAHNSADECDEAEAEHRRRRDGRVGRGSTMPRSRPRPARRPSRPTAPRKPRKPKRLTRPTPPTMPLARHARQLLRPGRRSSCPTMTHVELAQSDVIGGKNCNHGGAVSDANKAAKAERDAAKLAAKEAKQAAREAKTHGKANKHGKHGGQN